MVYGEFPPEFTTISATPLPPKQGASVTSSVISRVSGCEIVYGSTAVQPLAPVTVT